MKKVISFVLVLALVLGSFSMAFAAPVTDVAGDANEAAIVVVNDLGIVTGYTDGTFQADKAVNRAEFAAMIVRALGIPESALAGYSTTSFKDTAGYGWAVKYLAFCESKGIMLGDGNGNVMPGRTINTNEAMTMVLRALGLTDNSALLVGTWPSNYVTVAKNDGLYDNVDAVSTVDRGSAAQIIYNALTVAGYQVNADGETTQEEPTLLAGLDCTERKGIVDYEDDSLIALTEYVGAYANIYRNDDGEIVAVDPISTFVTGKVNADGKFETADAKYKIDVTTWDAITLLNAEDQSTPLTTVSGIVDDSTLAVEIVGKTIVDIYSMATWTVTANKQIEESDLEELADDNALLGIAFELNKSEEIDDAKYTVAGVTGIDKIAEEDVVYVYAYGGDDEANIVKVEVGTATVEGTVTKVYDDEGTTTYVIGGKDYVESTESGAAATASPAIGETGTAVLDYAGNIYDWVEEDTATDNYSIITDGLATYGRSETIVVLDKDGTETEYTIDSDITWDTTNATVGSIITFSLDKNGVIDGYTTYTAVDIDGKDVADDYSVIDKYAVDKNVVVFVKDLTDDSYSVGKITDLAETVTVDAILNSDADTIVALIVDTDSTGATDSTFGIITATGASIYVAADEKDYPVVDMILDGVAKADVIDDYGITAVTTSVGALQEITVDADGTITAVAAATDNAKVTKAAIGTTITAVNGSLIKTGTDSYRIAADAVIYVWDDTDAEWTVAKSLTAVKKCYVTLYDTDDNTANGYEVVMANEKASF